MPTGEGSNQRGSFKPKHKNWCCFKEQWLSFLWQLAGIINGKTKQLQELTVGFHTIGRDQHPALHRPSSHVERADKILLGSDYPLMSPTRVITQIESIGLSKDLETMIVGGNAKRLLEGSESAVSSL